MIFLNYFFCCCFNFCSLRFALWEQSYEQYTNEHYTKKIEFAVGLGSTSLLLWNTPCTFSSLHNTSTEQESAVVVHLISEELGICRVNWQVNQYWLLIWRWLNSTHFSLTSPSVTTQLITLPFTSLSSC